MDRTGFDDLMRVADGEARRMALADAARREGLAEASRTRTECGPSGASILFGMARIDSVVGGLPSRISLAAPNGHCAGLFMVRQDGRWRIGGDPDAVARASIAMPMSQMFSTMSHVLDAMGRGDDRHAREALRRVADWPEDPALFAAALDAALPLLDDHTVRAVVGHSHRVLGDAFMGRTPNGDVLLRGALIRTEMFPAYRPEQAYGVAGVLQRAAGNGDGAMVVKLLEPGSIVPGRSGPPPLELSAAMRAAVVSRWRSSAEIVARILAAGGVPPQPEGDGTLLHDVVRSVGSHDMYLDSAIDVARVLVRAGVPVEAGDGDGWSALDVLDRRIREIVEEAGREPEGAEALREELRSGPVPRRR